MSVFIIGLNHFDEEDPDTIILVGLLDRHINPNV